MATLKTILGVIGNETPTSVKTFGHNEAVIALLKHFSMDVAQVTKYYKLLSDLEWINESMEDFDADVLATVENLTKHGFEESCDVADVSAAADTEEARMIRAEIGDEAYDGIVDAIEAAVEANNAAEVDTHSDLSDEIAEYIENAANNKKLVDPDDINAAIEDNAKFNMRAYNRINKLVRKSNLGFRLFKEAMSKDYKIPPVTVNFVKPTVTTENNLVLPITDVHFGEIVKSTATFNNNYNGVIAQKRLEYLFSNAQQIAAKYGCKNAYVLLGGDLISGEIHQDLTMANEYPVLECCARVGKIIIALLEQYAKQFENVKVVCVPGNHSRTFKKPSTKDVVRNNYEYMIFQNIATAAKYISNVNVILDEDSPYAFFNVGTQLWMLEHGDRYSTPNKIPAEIRNTLNLRHADVCVMGHWHDMFEYNVERGDAKNATVVLNGSVIGPNDFATWKIKKHSPAASKCFITDGTEIICNKTIMLDHIQG